TAFALTKAAAPHLVASGAGSVVNISSVMGSLRARGFAAYGTVKAALSHLTRLLADDLAPRVRVNAVGVGSTATSALAVLLSDDAVRTAMVEATPLRRLAELDDIALAVLYLASPASSFVTGEVLDVDGGITTPNFDMGLPDL